MVCKTCSKCKKTKPNTAFHKRTTTASGVASRCKACTRERNQQRVKNDPFYWRVKNGNWKGIGVKFTAKEYLDKFDSQEGRCAICGRHQRNYKNNFSVDHNHKTGQIRGLVCFQCNHLIGFMESRKKIKNRIEKYLSFWNRKEKK